MDLISGIAKVFGGYMGLAVALGILIGIGQVFLQDIRALKKARAYVKKYVAQGLIQSSQRKDLPTVLLQAGRKALADGNPRKAHAYLYDCIALCKSKRQRDLKNAASVELARCLEASGRGDEALKLISSLNTPAADLFRSELLFENDPVNYSDFAILCAKDAMQYEELRDQAQALLQKVNEHNQHMEELLRIAGDALKPTQKDREVFARIAQKALKDIK